MAGFYVAGDEGDASGVGPTPVLTHHPPAGAGVADPTAAQLPPHAIELVKTAQLDVIKLNVDAGTNTLSQDVINRLREDCPDIRIMVRVFGKIFDPVRTIVDRLPGLLIAYANGVRIVELGNEPNTLVEGFGETHHSAAEYGQLWAAAERELRRHFPDITVLFPCPSPDERFTGDLAFEPFLRSSTAAARAAGGQWEGWAFHAYGPPGDIVRKVNAFASEKGRRVFVTEFSHAAAGKAQQATEYRAVFEADYRREVEALIGFVLYASGGWDEEMWDDGIARAVGQRQTH